MNEEESQTIENYSMESDSKEPENVAPLPEDLRAGKKKLDITDIINLASYTTLGIAGIFLLILFLLGFLR
jgi:hypothetical protein